MQGVEAEAPGQSAGTLLDALPGGSISCRDLTQPLASEVCQLVQYNFRCQGSIGGADG
jgi:hypothetical protein